MITIANGTKLARQVTKDEETTTRLYQNGLVFENGVLDHILTGEGKVAPFIPGNDELLDYQYFITDHLGNVRSVVREPRVYEYLATMETANADIEEEQFSNLPQTRQTDVAESHEGNAFSVTSNAMPLGPAFALNVTKGDVVDLSAFGKVKTGEGDTEVAGTEAIIAALVDALTNQSITIGESASTLSTGLAEGLGLLGMVGSTNAEATGYLNYLLFDEHFSLITGGFDLVTATGYQELTLSDITIDHSGYLIAWLSYESTAPDRVFFDDFRITLETSTVIQQEDYYPFGGTFNSYTKPGTIDQNYKYNQGTGEKTFRTERQPELEVDFSRYRVYDYWAPHWWQIDPKADQMGQESWSPYHYSFNNPIRFNDPYGRFPLPPLSTLVSKNNSFVDNVLDRNVSQPEKEVITSSHGNLIAGFRARKEYIKSYNLVNALTTQKKITGPTNGNGNALRHSLWSALNTQIGGEDFARDIGVAHEEGHPDDSKDQRDIDLHNNELGIRIGLENPDASFEELAKTLLDKIGDGEALVYDVQSGTVTKSKIENSSRKETKDAIDKTYVNDDEITPDGGY